MWYDMLPLVIGEMINKFMDKKLQPWISSATNQLPIWYSLIAYIFSGCILSHSVVGDDSDHEGIAIKLLQTEPPNSLKTTFISTYVNSAKKESYI